MEDAKHKIIKNIRKLVKFDYSNLFIKEDPFDLKVEDNYLFNGPLSKDKLVKSGILNVILNFT